MDLSGKTLLLMGGSAYSSSIERYAKEAKFKIIAVGNDPNAPYHKIADKAYGISTMEIEKIVEIVKQEHCDGVFVGASEVNIPCAIEVCERTGIHFYTDRKLWSLLSNKRLFKELLKKHGLEVTKEYDFIDIEKRKAVEYPVIIKPIDGSGARGISIANSQEELENGYKRACSVSWTNSALVEKYITGLDDMFIHYTIIDGECSLSCTLDRHLNYSQGGFTGMAVGYTYPSVYTSQYINLIDQKMKKALLDSGIVNGAINIQCFTNGKYFFFYECGYRLGGEQMYFFTEKLTGINVLEMIINQALTGKMETSSDVLKKDDPFFKKPCLSYYIPLKPGKIGIIKGINEIRQLEGVINITEFLQSGDVVEKDGSLNQVALRMHLMAENVEGLSDLVDEVNKLLKINDTKGSDMIIERLKFKDLPYYHLYDMVKEHKGVQI